MLPAEWEEYDQAEAERDPWWEAGEDYPPVDLEDLDED